MFVEALLAMAATGAVTAGAAFIRRDARRWDVAIAAIAARSGLQVRRATWARSAMLRGEIDGLDVCVDLRSSSEDGQRFTRVRLRHPSLPSCRIEAHGVRLLGKALGLGGRLDVGDAAFDGLVRVRDLTPAELLARMDTEARLAVAALVEAGGWLGGGALTLERQGRIDNLPELEGMLAVALRAGGALLGGDGYPRLLERAAADPVGGVRRRALEVVIAVGGYDPDWMRGIAEGDDPGEVLLAASALGERGRDRLWWLARSTCAERRDAAVALSRLPPDDAAPELEAILLGLFVQQPDGALADALGRCASVRAVPFLTGSIGPLGVGAVARASREAVLAIQGRATGVVGGLALVDSLGGALSLPATDEVRER